LHTTTTTPPLNITKIQSNTMGIFKLLQQMKMVWHPIASPLLIGLSLPELYYEKRYNELPILIVAPVFYTGLIAGIELFKIKYS
jgi:hypothetical protein